jgi:hypothetical protein
MLKITVNTNLPAQVNKAIARFDQKQAALLQEIGQTLLSRQQLSFEKKSRRGMGDDGIVWKPLAKSTEERKARKGKAKTAAAKVSDLKKKLAKAKTKKERTKILKQIQGALTPPKSQIGVDTGIMRNCVVPGYKAPDGKGGNILEVNGSTVTVGYAREYAPWFDEGTERQPARPLMPDRMPEQWMTAIEKVVTDWASDIVAELER